MARAKHIGIAAVSAEGAALRYRTVCTKGAAHLGRHEHPRVTMRTHPLAEYLRHLEAERWHDAARLLVVRRQPRRRGAEFPICPDNRLHQALDLAREQSPAPWPHIAGEAASAGAALPRVAGGLMLRPHGEPGSGVTRNTEVVR